MKNFVGIKDIAVVDSYLIRGYHGDAFDHVIDIGSNVGQFSVVARILFPEAKITSYEPCLKTYNVLCENMDGFYDVNLINKALGDGSPLYFMTSGGNSPTCTGHLFKGYNTGAQMVDSVSIGDIFEECGVGPTDNILLKIDCEGGERFLLEDENSHLLKLCKHFCIEIHFKCKKYRNFDDLPDYIDYHNWMHDMFNETHDILYHRSRKDRGVGIYVVRIKKDSNVYAMSKI